MTDKGVLQIAHIAVFAQALNGPNPSAIGLDCKRQATSHNLAVDFDRARATNPMFTTKVGALETEFTTDKINQMRSWLHMSLRALSVHGQINAL
jgi:hypothetical protein